MWQAAPKQSPVAKRRSAWPSRVSIWLPICSLRREACHCAAPESWTKAPAALDQRAEYRTDMDQRAITGVQRAIGARFTKSTYTFVIKLAHRPIGILAMTTAAQGFRLSYSGRASGPDYERWRELVGSRWIAADF